MGLLDYIKANTPRATTPRVSPSTVIREGLLNPNQFNAPAANRFKDSLFGLAGVVPGVGDVASGVEAADLWNRGEKGNAGLAALGMLPFIPVLGGILKNSNPDFGLWGVKTGNTETLNEGSIKVPFIDDKGNEYGHIVYRETPTEIIIDGLGRNRTNREHKGSPTRAVKAMPITTGPTPSFAGITAIVGRPNRPCARP